MNGCTFLYNLLYCENKIKYIVHFSNLFKVEKKDNIYLYGYNFNCFSNLSTYFMGGKQFGIIAKKTYIYT